MKKGQIKALEKLRKVIDDNPIIYLSFIYFLNMSKKSFLEFCKELESDLEDNNEGD